MQDPRAGFHITGAADWDAFKTTPSPTHLTALDYWCVWYRVTRPDPGPWFLLVSNCRPLLFRSGAEACRWVHDALRADGFDYRVLPVTLPRPDPAV